jgi:hypothetical protein
MLRVIPSEPTWQARKQAKLLERWLNSQDFTLAMMPTLTRMQVLQLRRDGILSKGDARTMWREASE